MYFQSYTSILEILLTVSVWSSGSGQPSNYNYQGHHYSPSSSSSDSTGHIRAPHARGARSHTQKDHHHQHYVPHKPAGVKAGTTDYQTKLLHDKQLLHDKEHLKEDMGEWLFKDGKEMSPEEMEFHYFKSHDFDNNSKLDGLEILQAISHILPMTEVDTDLTAGGNSPSSPQANLHNHDHREAADSEARRAEMIKQQQLQRDEDFNYYIDLIDKVLDEDDLNKDGYLSYLEYAIGRRREEEQQVQNHATNVKTGNAHRY